MAEREFHRVLGQELLRLGLAIGNGLVARPRSGHLPGARQNCRVGLRPGKGRQPSGHLTQTEDQLLHSALIATEPVAVEHPPKVQRCPGSRHQRRVARQSVGRRGRVHKRGRLAVGPGRQPRWRRGGSPGGGGESGPIGALAAAGAAAAAAGAAAAEEAGAAAEEAVVEEAAAEVAAVERRVLRGGMLRLSNISLLLDSSGVFRERKGGLN